MTKQLLVLLVAYCQLLTVSAFQTIATTTTITPRRLTGWHTLPTPSMAQSRRTSAPPRTISTVSTTTTTTSTLRLQAVVQDLNVVGLVAGQENYGLAIVVLGEAIWSLLQAPSVSYAVRLLVPSGIAALVLFLVSGPMIQSGNAESVGLGLSIATLVSLGVGANYVLRLTAPYSPSPKEIAALGFLLSVAGLVSFTQNLLVDGFVTLPSIDLPTLPSIDLFPAE